MPAFKRSPAIVIILCLFFSRQVIAQKLIPPPFVLKEWETEYKPFRIVGNLYYVGTYDLACFLIATPEGNILINTGLAESVGPIKLNIESLGFKFSDIKILLATHAHFDHVAGMDGYPDIAKDYAYTFDALKKLKFDIWLSSHASQFRLHQKHKTGVAYRPDAFIDQSGYDETVGNLEKAYLRRLKK